MSDPITWHKCEAKVNSELGTNPTWGPTPAFDASGKFGNAYEAEDNANYMRFSLPYASYNNFQQFGLSFFTKAYMGITNGVPDYSTAYIVLFSLHDSISGARYEMYYSRDGSAGTTFSCGFEGGLAFPTLSANQWVHWVWNVNSAGVDGSGDTVRLYQDDVLVYNNSHVIVAMNNNPTFYAGTELGTYYGLSGLDNPKFYDHTLSSFERNWDLMNEGLYVRPVASSNFFIINC